ncbi:DUF6183 family protein [Streptomyces sp. ISL-86]|uniref:DUF6183 family protein n=1 Tax=Streptomyces sp. ISL-86 TaxID=2819187 RepID=UPI001BEBFBC5|nr:DUF6183 family protein [Streptomyces sp. ISL-86]MBT2458327.1 hypothetical protein [Streptomyces sp. ISL-86]
MSKDITRTVAALHEANDADVFALRAKIDLRVSDGEFDWVGDLGVGVASRAAAGKDLLGHYGTVLDHIIGALVAHPGLESLRTLLRVPASPHLEGPERTRAERRLAALVAHGHRIEDIARSVFTRNSESVHSREFSACLLHELVLDSVQVEEHPALRSFAGTLVAGGHPLALLPLSLLPEEGGLRRPASAADDWTWTVPPTPLVSFDAPELQTTPSMRQRMAGIDMTEISVPASAELMGAAVQHWCTQSNGKVAAQEFWSPDPVTSEDFPAAFKLLPLIPWPADQAPARLYPSTPDSVLRVLLTAAVRGPAYGSGLYGAYGRLAAWRSLGGLTGAAADAPITHTAELVRQTRWFRVDTASMWFYEVAWDLAIAALRPGGQEIAVLAATDTD